MLPIRRAHKNDEEAILARISRGQSRIARNGVIASAVNNRRIVHSPIWRIASLTGRAPSQSSAKANATHAAGRNRVMKTASFSGDRWPL